MWLRYYNASRQKFIIGHSFLTASILILHCKLPFIVAIAGVQISKPYKGLSYNNLE